jgi:hypothetical protein
MRFIAYSWILAAAIAASSLLTPVSANAWTSGALIKGTKPDVFYVTSTGKKLAFPDEQTYFSWYSDFNVVQKVSDATLNNMPLAGYATIRPGTKLVKIKGVAKVYAVSRGEILRWVKTEAVAKAIYGDTWNKSVITLPTVQFQNYRIGEDIANGSQYSAQTEQAAAPNINTDLNIAMTIRGFTP